MSRNVKLGILGLAAILLLYPLLFSGAFALNVGSAVLLAAISASAWNIVGGYAGQISVGHGMFFGVGAYLPLLIYQITGLPPLAGVPVGIALSIILAIIIGLPAFRQKVTVSRGVMEFGRRL